ncbi:MAG: hypothetical protein B7Z68_00375 [Acidobacteria bacterium 21-70-11]|nr:MAG: hypothetical protein B7Z68_00375 [Acidobacteria bacterium 21-70-11]OYW05141.1 MAG: hypothetical protein B7Z61_07235 [Acidobacteria bacterium 37-71-11]HQT94924.1 hypothetical protein [Thermoanaerobaculaceae bacterium]HQU34269.1 hypothetical protein [Thermoanaerobaculaceae bacterium]
MKVRLERSGGVANIRRTVTVDAAALPSERAEELHRLVAAADLATIPENPTPLAGRPDRFVYRLTIEDEASGRSVSVNEETASEPVRHLIDWLQASAEG